MKIVLLAIVIFLSAVSLKAQQVGPIINELKAGKNGATGQMTVVNNSLRDLNTVIEPMSFDVTPDGAQTLRPLDSKIHVELGQSSLKIPAKQARTIYYRIRCATYPCFVSLFASMTGPHVNSGLMVALHIPSVVYVCSDSAKNCRQRVRRYVFRVADWK